jgi:hypothetical protein
MLHDMAVDRWSFSESENISACLTLYLIQSCHLLVSRPHNHSPGAGRNVLQLI